LETAPFTVSWTTVKAGSLPPVSSFGGGGATAVTMPGPVWRIAAEMPSKVTWTPFSDSGRFWFTPRLAAAG